MDKSHVCTIALHYVGEQTYAPERPAYASCELFWRPCYLEILAVHDWSHARRRRTLRPRTVYADNLDPAPADSAAQRHDIGALTADNDRPTVTAWRLPVDCLRVVELSGLDRWRIFGRDVIPEGAGGAGGGGEVAVVYTSSALGDDGQLPDIAVGFCDALSLLLASKLAMSLKHDRDMAGQLMAMYSESLERAIVIDVRQDGSNDQHPLEEMLSRNIISGSEIDRRGKIFV